MGMIEDRWFAMGVQLTSGISVPSWVINHISYRIIYLYIYLTFLVISNQIFVLLEIVDLFPE